MVRNGDKVQPGQRRSCSPAAIKATLYLTQPLWSSLQVCVILEKQGIIPSDGLYLSVVIKSQTQRGEMSRLHRPFLNSISRTSAVVGESSGFLVIMYRSAGACC